MTSHLWKDEKKNNRVQLEGGRKIWGMIWRKDWLVPIVKVKKEGLDVVVTIVKWMIKKKDEGIYRLTKKVIHTEDEALRKQVNREKKKRKGLLGNLI